MLSDIEIANSAKLLPITEIAEKIGLSADELIPYGQTKAKIANTAWERVKSRPDGRLILVTAINPTPAGEGKTTTTVGLGQAMSLMGLNAMIALREPSLGPVFGIKGGAAGGGYAQVVPMEDINLHFTGDIHAVTAANNLLCAVIDNHIYQGNELDIDPERVLFKRVMDMNDRALRNTTVGNGKPTDGVPREDHFMISVASEVMAILCLASDLSDLKKRLGDILVAYNMRGEPVYCRELKVNGSMAALLRDALLPNLVQTLENTPVFIHGGPFANIAHGCNSVKATRLALKLCDYVVTEAGFGSDLGAEKFFDIKCRAAGLKPDCAVLVATARALKYNGGVPKDMLKQPDADAVIAGLDNLRAHIQNLKKFGVPVVVAINRFEQDTPQELEAIRACCEQLGARYAESRVFAEGGKGGLELARTVVETTNAGGGFAPLYPLELSIKEKIECIAREIYGADGVDYSEKALADIEGIQALCGGKIPVCIAKTQYSLSDDPKLLGRPRGFRINVREVSYSAGAGFAVAVAGSIMTMPGLPKQPAACSIDIDENGVISGLF